VLQRVAVTFSLSSAGIRGILLDIEGTTTPISFVYDVLFPFVRQELRVFFEQNVADPKIQEIVRALNLEHNDDVKRELGIPEWDNPPLVYINWMMDQDRKSTALKVLQGKIWDNGYRTGKLAGQVFQDVPPALERWRRQDLDIRIFSSGSELAQRLLFSSTTAGNLNQYLSGYFDTTLGPKTDPESYKKIAASFQLQPAEIAFVSDVTRELDPARKSGMSTLLCLRPGNHPQVVHGHRTITSFDQIQ
jgi:enolase-phosphatase E1